MIVFLGAEFTKQFALHYGHGIEPKKDAVLIEESREEKHVKDKKNATGQTHREPLIPKRRLGRL
jgi:hypothetical protein